ncbi:MAG: hypothetical protein V2I43_29470 [Parvularcula sp.]|jgi:hypothetical protein|nr:hypothetical protein [Parvularcula sp.]
MSDLSGRASLRVNVEIFCRSTQAREHKKNNGLSRQPIPLKHRCRRHRNFLLFSIRAHENRNGTKRGQTMTMVRDLAGFTTLIGLLAAAVMIIA